MRVVYNIANEIFILNDLILLDDYVEFDTKEPDD